MSRIKIFRKLQLFLPLVISYLMMLSVNYAQTSEEWAAIGEEYLNYSPPDYYYAADAYIYAGEAAINEENYSKAKEYFEKALDINKSLNDDSIIGRAYDGLGEVAHKLGDFETAINNYLIAAQKYLQINEYLSAGWSYVNAGSAACWNNDFNHAEEYYLNGADAFNKGNYKNVAFCYLSIAACAHEFKDYDNAFKYINMSAEKYISTKEYSSAGYAYDLAGTYAKENGDCEAALEYWDKAKTNYDIAGKSYSVPTCELEIIVDSPNNYDKYYQGDAILFKGKIKYGDKQIVPTDSKVILELSVPNHLVSIGNRTSFIKTDDVGNYLALPYAGWNVGEYTVVMRVRYWLESKNKYITAEKTIVFEVIIPPPTDIRTQLDKIVQRYKSHPTDSIKWGPIHENPPSGIPECMFGSYNNLNYTTTGNLKW
ncbi:MAG: tetratricopeptide repeat protein, partial [Melioribacteraceae bacterium]